MSAKPIEDTGVAWGFEQRTVLLAIDAIIPLKPLRPDVKLSTKYRQIATSIRAVGLVEPPVVTRWCGIELYNCGPWCQGPAMARVAM